MITVFYDGSCSLCSREINHYRKIAPAGVFAWVDITRDPEPLTKLGYRLQDGLRQLHTRDDQGRMHRGIDSFLLIWQHLDRWRWLAGLVRLWGIYHVAALCYRLFARWRFKRLGYDKITS